MSENKREINDRSKWMREKKNRRNESVKHTDAHTQQQRKIEEMRD